MLFPKCLKDVKAKINLESQSETVHLTLFGFSTLSLSLGYLIKHFIYRRETAHRKTMGLVLGAEPKRTMKNVAEWKINA